MLDSVLPSRPTPSDCFCFSLSEYQTTSQFKATSECVRLPSFCPINSPCFGILHFHRKHRPNLTTTPQNEDHLHRVGRLRDPSRPSHQHTSILTTPPPAVSTTTHRAPFPVVLKTPSPATAPNSLYQAAQLPSTWATSNATSKSSSDLATTSAQPSTLFYDLPSDSKAWACSA